MSSIMTLLLSLSLENQLWALDIFILKRLHSSGVLKRCTRFRTQVRILILHLSFMNNFSHYIFTSYNIYIIYVIRSCFECHLTVFYMSHFLPLFVKLLTFLVGFELTTRDDLLSVDSNTLPLCHGRLWTCFVICICLYWN